MTTALLCFMALQDPCSMELLTSMNAIKPGQPFMVAVKLKMEPGWHTYWRNPGDSGSATTLTWKLPEGWKAGEIQWPVPQAIPSGEFMTNFGFEGEAVLLTQIIPSDQPRTGKVDIGVKASWVVCKSECLMGSGEASVPVLVSAFPTIQREGMAVVKKALEALPTELPAGRATAVQGPKLIDVTLDVEQGDAKLTFFPYEPLHDHNSLEFKTEGGKAKLSIHMLQFGSEGAKRLRGLVVASKPGVWGDKSTAKVIDLPVSSS